MPTMQRQDEHPRCGLSTKGVQSTQASKRPRIFILSDVRLYREGLTLTLSRSDAVQVLGAAAPAEAFARLAELLPDIAVLDSSSDGSLQLTRRMREIVPGIKIVAFAVSDVDQDMIACAE